ncbi:hypothetical protein MT418_005623 [Batrachochytrium dendrobatidis]
MTGHLLLHYQHSCRSFVDKLNEVQVDSNTGKSYSEPKQSALDIGQNPFYVRPPMSNSPGPKLQSNTSGKKTPELKGPSSNSDTVPLDETSPPTGSTYGTTQYWENLKMFPPIYVYAVIINCEELGRTIYNRLEFSKLSWFTVSVVTGLIPGEPAFASSSVAPVNHDSSENSSRLYVIRPNSSQLIITAYTYIWGNICKVSQYGITPN